VRRSLTIASVALLLGGLPGCEKIQALLSPPKPAASAAPEGDHKKAPEGHGDKDKTASEEPKSEGPEEFALPFAWEQNAEEPLGRTRSFLRDTFTTNGDYMTLEGKQLLGFADKQTPRATVLTCADSRVHTTAFDASPENDDFLIRNIGNQVDNAEGSIEYGVEHLDTPLLFIVGHTGCGAVRAAMDGIEKLPGPIQKELENLHPPKADPKKNAREAWVAAVVANVHSQVTTALDRFGKRVHSGRLTIVGAVLDIRNDIGLGAGRLILVDVNGNQDQKRIAAFIQAVTGKAAPELRLDEPKESKPPEERARSTADLLHALAALPPARGKAKKPAGEGDSRTADSEHAPD
jgi:carbonic anhydrase